MNIILMGPPGAGKGTQAKKIIGTFNIPHISTGDMFREAIRSGSELGVLAASFIDKGQLVPDEVTIGLVKERLSKDDCKNGFLLDGFPRTIPQAEALEVLTNEINRPITTVINIAADKEALIKRICGRRVCKTCAAPYHVDLMPSKVEGVCDLCGGPLIQRKDDTVEVLNERLDAYQRQTYPLINFYEERNLCKHVDGLRSIDEVFENIQDILKGE